MQVPFDFVCNEGGKCSKTILKHVEGHYDLNEEGNFFASCVLLVVRTSHYLGPVYTMDHEVGPWKMAFSMV